MARERSSRDKNIPPKSTNDFILGHASWLKVGKLIDGYLAEIARDPNVNLSIFIELLQSIPDSARPIHDALYESIDIYLQEHSSLTKAEKKHLCGLMDVRKLTMDASMHAAQNERLPLRTVVQVLFFEQIRAAAGVQTLNHRNTDAVDSSRMTEKEYWQKTLPEKQNVSKPSSEIKIKGEDPQKNMKLLKKGSKNRSSGPQLMPSRSRRIFDKLFIGKASGNGENSSPCRPSSRSGRAYLINKVVNLTYGETEERTLLSGTYTVKDIFCRICGQILGWKYEKSHDESLKYNEGKFVLERIRIIDDDDDNNEFYIDTRSSSSDDEAEDTV